MGYTLQKPYIEEQRLDFIVKYNHNLGLTIKETDMALYALEPWERLEGDTVIEDRKGYEEKKAQEAREQKQQQLKAELSAIDLQAVRPLRAIAAGTATDEDRAKLAELEAQAEKLRAELGALGGN